MAAPSRSGTGRAPRRARTAAPPKPGPWRRLRSLLGGFAWRRWVAVFTCVAVLLIGIPLAHAMVGDLGALLLLVGVGGFALGRSTAPERGVMRTGKGRGAASGSRPGGRGGQ